LSEQQGVRPDCRQSEDKHCNDRFLH
jgi:hypothetical protein